MIRPWIALTGLILSLHVSPGTASDTLHFPADTEHTAPRQLDIQGALDIPQFRPVLEAFHERHPDIELRYRNFTTLDLYQRFLEEETDTPDVTISSAMPWQYLLANNGHAQPLESPSLEQWPAWARWRDELFAITFEPIVIVYHRDLEVAIDSHASLLGLLEQEREALRGKVVTYDPARSGAGYTYAIEEARLSPRYWELVSALGSVEADLVETTGEMLDGLASGKYLIGYNLLGSYARDYLREQSDLVMVIPDDYALVVQRLAFIPRDAPHPETAERFMTFLLSEEGQRLLAEQTTLGAVHPLLTGPGTASELREELGDALRPIRLGPGLLATLDDLKREALLSRWSREFER